MYSVWQVFVSMHEIAVFEWIASCTVCITWHYSAAKSACISASVCLVYNALCVRNMYCNCVL